MILPKEAYNLTDSFTPDPHKPQHSPTEKGIAPTTPPPSTVPEHQPMPLSIDPGALRGCLYRDTYIRLVNRSSFWFHPTYIDYVSTTGYKWTGAVWIPWGTDLDQIISFQCT